MPAYRLYIAHVWLIINSQNALLSFWYVKEDIVFTEGCYYDFIGLLLSFYLFNCIIGT